MERTKQVQEGHLSFRHESIETFVSQCLTNEIKRAQKITSGLFIAQLEQSCKLLHHLSILRKVFFMEAGLQMHLFTRDIFDSLDKGIKVNNTVLLNGHFQESVEGIAGKGLFGKNVDSKRMQVFFRGEPKNFSTESIEALDYLGFNFASDWPLDIIFDTQSIEKYNTIFSFLLRIRRCNYII